MTPDVFRSRFPALEHTVWLDTPAAAPGASPVVDAVLEALEAWRTGGRHWSAWWEETSQECRSLIAAYLRAEILGADCQRDPAAVHRRVAFVSTRAAETSCR